MRERLLLAATVVQRDDVIRLHGKHVKREGERELDPELAFALAKNAEQCSEGVLQKPRYPVNPYSCKAKCGSLETKQ